MAHFAVQAIPSHFQQALSAYDAIAALRGSNLNEDQVETIEDVIDPLFENVVRTPAQSPGMIVAKGEIILAEYGEGEGIQAWMLIAILEDVRRLVQ